MAGKAKARCVRARPPPPLTTSRCDAHNHHKKNSTLIVRLISTAQTGFFYTTQRPRLGPKLAAVKYDPLGPCVRAIPSHPIPSHPIYHLPFVPPFPSFSPLYSLSSPSAPLFVGELRKVKEKRVGRVTFLPHHLCKSRRCERVLKIPLFLFFSFPAVKRRVLFVEGKKTKK